MFKRKNREVICDCCEEPFESRATNVKYCPECRPHMYEKKRREAVLRSGMVPMYTVITCGCGADFLKTAKGQKYCPDCRAQRDVHVPLGEFTCEICGGTHKKGQAKQVRCVEKCKPMEGLELVCNECGLPKSYDEFPDYRDAAHGRFIKTCKRCLSAKSLRAYHRKNNCR